MTSVSVCIEMMTMMKFRPVEMEEEWKGGKGPRRRQGRQRC